MNFFTFTSGLLVELLAVVAVMMLAVPHLARPEIFFALTVTEDFRGTKEARRILRGYRIATIVASLAAAGLLFHGFATRSPAVIAAALVLQLVGITAAFIVARHRTLPHRVQGTPIREADLGAGAGRLPGGPILQAGPFVLLAGAAIFVATQWQRLPARFPIHWDLAGNPNGFATRTPAAILGPVILGAVVCAMILVLSLVMLHRSRRTSVTGPAAEAETHFRRLVLGVILASEYLVAVTFGLQIVMPLMRGPEVPVGVILGLTGVFVGVATVVLARVGQGGSRLAAATGGATPVGDRMADSHWYWGLYANRDDPAILVEKRFGIGVTFNFGNVWSWVILVGIVAVPLLLVLVLRLAH